MNLFNTFETLTFLVLLHEWKNNVFRVLLSNKQTAAPPSCMALPEGMLDLCKVFFYQYVNLHLFIVRRWLYALCLLILILTRTDLVWDLNSKLQSTHETWESFHCRGSNTSLIMHVYNPLCHNGNHFSAPQWWKTSMLKGILVSPRGMKDLLHFLLLLWSRHWLSISPESHSSFYLITFYCKQRARPEWGNQQSSTPQITINLILCSYLSVTLPQLWETFPLTAMSVPFPYPLCNYRLINHISSFIYLCWKQISLYSLED